MPQPLYADFGHPSSSSGPSQKKDIIDTVSDEALARKLEIALNEVQPLLEDAESKQFTSNAVRNWLTELKCSIYDAESTLDFICNVALCNKVTEEVPYDSSALVEFKRRIPGKVENIIATLEGLIDKSGRLGLDADASVGVIPPASLRKNRVTTSLVEESEIFGRVDEKEQIIGWVLSEEPPITGTKVDVISIVGMGGVGKTILAQLVYNDPRISSSDYLISWVYVSDTFEAARLTKEILVSFTDASFGTDYTWDVLQRKLCKVLDGKKFLVVLDDVWDWDPKSMQVWDRFFKPFSRGAHGSKMIVTTRNDRVASALRSRHRLQLNQLSEEDGWSFFSQSVFPTGEANTHPLLVAIGREIVKKCKGLPLAINAAIGILRGLGQDAIQWKRVLESKLWNVESVLPALALSYCYLPQNLKRIFAYCSLIPKGHTIISNLAMMRWIEEGFVQPQDGIGSMEAQSKLYFDELVSRSFFKPIVHQIWCYKMHDLTHDLAEFVSAQICKLSTTNESITSYARIRHMYFFAGISGIVNSEDLSEVRSLHINLKDSYHLDPFMCKEVIGEVSSRLLFLRVLCLNGNLIDDLPHDIGNLRLLRHLNVSYSKVKELPASVCNLSNLRTLNCKFCNDLQELPWQIGNLVSLQYLYANNTAIKELPPSLCCLSNLEFLYLRHCHNLRKLPDEMTNLVSLGSFDVSCTAIDELPASLCLLPNLETLDCSGCRHLQQLPNTIGGLPSLRGLYFTGAALDGGKLPAWLCEGNRWEISDGMACRINP